MRKITVKVEENGSVQEVELKPQEFELILAIRDRYRFGEIIIECRDGVPFRVCRTAVYEKLSEK